MIAEDLAAQAQAWRLDQPAGGEDIFFGLGHLIGFAGDELDAAGGAFRESAAGRQTYIQGSTLAVWEIMLLVQSYKGDVSAVAKHLKWPEAKVLAAVNYAKAFPEEIESALSENAATNLEVLKRMLPQASEFVSKRAPKN